MRKLRTQEARGNEANHYKYVEGKDSGMLSQQASTEHLLFTQLLLGTVGDGGKGKTFSWGVYSGIRGRRNGFM